MPNPQVRTKFVFTANQESSNRVYGIIKAETTEDVLVRRVVMTRNSPAIMLGGVTITAEDIYGKYKTNKVKCHICNDTIESKYEFNTVWCSCGNCRIDGGPYKLIRKCKSSRWTELSETN
jgi:hypothetical protein